VTSELQSHVTQKLRQISKIRSEQSLTLSSSLRISSHLPAPILNRGGDRLWKCKNFEISSFVTLISTVDWVIWHHSLGYSVVQWLEHRTC